MMRVNFGRAMAAFCAVIVSCCTAGAAEDVLKVVPSEALGVVVINDVGQTDGKLNELASQLQLPPPSLLATAKIGLNLKEGFDEEGSMAMAAVPAGENGPPVMVAFLPASDFQALIKQLNPEEAGPGTWKISIGETKNVIAAQKDGFAVVTEESDRAALEAVLTSNASIAAATPSLDAWRGENDAYAIATPAGVKFAQQQVLAGLAIAKGQMSQLPEAQAQQAKMGIEMYEALFKSLDKEITYAAGGVRIGDDGVHLVGRTLLAEGGFLAQMAASAKPGKADVLTGLPQMPFVFAGGGVMSAEAAEPMMKASLGIMKMYPGGQNMTEEQFSKIIKMSVRPMQGMRSMGMMLGVGEGDQPLYSSMLLSMKVDNADHYFDEYSKLASEMGKIMSDAEFPFSYEVESMQIDGRRGLKLVMDMEEMFGEQEVPEAEKMMELMFGSEGKMSVYMAVADESTILGSYVSDENLLKALKNFEQDKEQLADEPSVAKVMKMLDEDAHFIGLWSPQGTLAFASRLAGAINPNAAAVIPQLDESPPVGFTAKLSPAGLETDMAVPADVMKSIAELVQQIMAQRGQAAPGAL